MSKSRTTTERLAPVHPGDVLADALKEAGISANAAAIAMGIPANRLTAIVRAQRGVTADTAMRLGRFFGTSARFWLNLQTRHDLQVAERELAERIVAEVRPLRKSA